MNYVCTYVQIQSQLIFYSYLPYRMSPDIGDLKEFFHIRDDSTQVCLYLNIIQFIDMHCVGVAREQCSIPNCYEGVVHSYA